MDDKRWKTCCTNYYIVKAHSEKRYYIEQTTNRETQTVYFVSAEVTRRAIDEIVIPFEKGELEVCKIWEK